MVLENDSFLEISREINNPQVQAWQEDHKKVIGHYCTLIPEELLHAVEFLPFRIRATGHEETDLGDVYMVRFTCSFVRASLDMALKGMYDFLDGLIICNSCDHSRRMFELFNAKVFNRDSFKKEVSRFYLVMPHTISDEGFDWYSNEIKRLKNELEKLSNIQISEEALIKSINLYNKNRKLLREIQHLRTLDAPKLTGSQALEIYMANSSTPKEYANKEIERIINELESFEGIKSAKKRIMLIGSDLDSTFFTDIVENSDAIIISDLMCYGVKNFADDVILENGKEPLECISKRLYYRLSCPRMMNDHQRRLQYVKDEIKHSRIDGVILQKINNCDLHGCDNMLFSHELKELNIPILNLDREFFQSDTTRLRTRIEAFLEMIK